MMNMDKIISETKEYMRGHLGTSTRGDMHTLPLVHRDDLWNYLRSLHARFPRGRFRRFVRKLESRGLILESRDRSLVFDPTFSF